MKPLRIMLALVAALCVFQVCSTEASAQWRSGWGGTPGWYGYGGYGYGYARLNPPPHFSLFPPVYYGERVRMTYGDRPFSWPPRQHHRVVKARVAEVKQGPSEMIINPYVKEASDASTTGNFASFPKVIENPYVNDELAPLPGNLIRTASFR